MNLSVIFLVDRHNYLQKKWYKRIVARKHFNYGYALKFVYNMLSV